MRWTDLLVDYNNPRSLGSRLRRRRVQLFLELVRQCHREHGSCRILDIGGSQAYWRIVGDAFLDAHDCHITLLNTAPLQAPPRRRFTHVVGDGCRLDFGDNAFDIAHSNSVIEHVGDWQRKSAFAAECSRVARRHYVQTPNFWFPVEPHYLVPGFQFLPMQIQAALLCRLSLGRIQRRNSLAAALETVQGIQLLTEGMLRALFPHSEILCERVFGLKKSLIAIRR
jgi:hypothetical protein